MFKAIVLDKNEGLFQARIADLDEKALPEGDVVIAVDYSTINYKDALAITNASPDRAQVADGAGHRRRGHGAREHATRCGRPATA